MTPLEIYSVATHTNDLFPLASTWCLLCCPHPTYPCGRVRQRPGGEDNIEGVSMRHVSVGLHVFDLPLAFLRKYSLYGNTEVKPRRTKMFLCVKNIPTHFFDNSSIITMVGVE